VSDTIDIVNQKTLDLEGFFLLKSKKKTHLSVGLFVLNDYPVLEED